MMKRMMITSTATPTMNTKSTVRTINVSITKPGSAPDIEDPPDKRCPDDWAKGDRALSGQPRSRFGIPHSRATGVIYHRSVQKRRLNSCFDGRRRIPSPSNTSRHVQRSNRAGRPWTGRVFDRNIDQRISVSATPAIVAPEFETHGQTGVGSKHTAAIRGYDRRRARECDR